MRTSEEKWHFSSLTYSLLPLTFLAAQSPLSNYPLIAAEHTWTHPFCLASHIQKHTHPTSTPATQHVWQMSCLASSSSWQCKQMGGVDMDLCHLKHTNYRIPDICCSFSNRDLQIHWEHCSLRNKIFDLIIAPMQHYLYMPIAKFKFKNTILILEFLLSYTCRSLQLFQCPYRNVFFTQHLYFRMFTIMGAHIYTLWTVFEEPQLFFLFCWGWMN